MAGTGINQERQTKTVLRKSISLDAAITAAVNGAAVDLHAGAASGPPWPGFGSATALLDVGLQGGSASPSTTFKIEESEDGSAWNVAPDRDVLGFVNSTGLVITTANDERTHVAGYIGTKRNIRWVVSAVSGTSPTLRASGTVMLSDARREPVVN